MPAALLNDLKRRGMLDETLVVWAGEFGRIPCRKATRAPSAAITTTRRCPSGWLGPAFGAGAVHGTTDELGYAAAQDVCTVHDLHATMLHQLGINHEAFSVKFQGLDARLTGVERPTVIRGILA